MKSKITERHPIKAILFDMVGVLLFAKKGYIPKTKAEINASSIEKLYNHTDDKKLLEDIKTNLDLSKTDLKKALEHIPQKFEMYGKIWKILPGLRKDYRMAVINNGNALAMKYWNKSFDFSIFDLFINSAQVGIKKPDPGIFLLTCKELKVSPKECIFMDDSLENIQSAQKLGMTTIWWNKEQTKEENLREFLKVINK